MKLFEWLKYRIYQHMMQSEEMNDWFSEVRDAAYTAKKTAERAAKSSVEASVNATNATAQVEGALAIVLSLQKRVNKIEGARAAEQIPRINQRLNELEAEHVDPIKVHHDNA